MATTRALGPDVDVTAPDGSDIRLLTASGRLSQCYCNLPPFAVSTAVRHRAVEEVWFVEGGTGWLWLDGEVLDLKRGVSVIIPAGTPFQMRASPAGLEVLITTVPPWPGADEAIPVDGRWEATVGRAARGPQSGG